MIPVAIPFERSLAETIAWCTPRARADDPRGSLRSEKLRPRALEASYAASVDHVAHARARILATERGRSPTASGGRLLAYLPDFDLACGSAEIESNGFFDVHNCPPWDTWVGLRTIEDDRVLLVSWVPPTLVAQADAGIWINPEECIAWLDAITR